MNAHSWEVVVHGFDPSTQEAEAGKSLWVWGHSGLASSSLELVQGQPRLHRETLFQPAQNEHIQKLFEVLFGVK